MSESICIVKSLLSLTIKKWLTFQNCWLAAVFFSHWTYQCSGLLVAFELANQPPWELLHFRRTIDPSAVQTSLEVLDLTQTCYLIISLVSFDSQLGTHGKCRVITGPWRDKKASRGSSFALKNRKRSLLDFQFFDIFETKIAFFRHFFLTVRNLHLEERSIVTIGCHIFGSFRGWNWFFHDVHNFIGLRSCFWKSSNFKLVKNT